MKISKCFFCNKIRHLTYHITEINKGIAESYEMCKSCADAYLGNKETASKTLSLNDVETWEQLLNFISDFGAESVSPDTKPPCECGLTELEFETVGRFGCEKCYSHFKEKIEELVYPYHKANFHDGKKPKRYMKELLENDIVEKTKVLKLKLAKAIELEDFEKAKIIQHELSDLERHQ